MHHACHSLHIDHISTILGDRKTIGECVLSDYNLDLPPWESMSSFSSIYIKFHHFNFSIFIHLYTLK